MYLLTMVSRLILAIICLIPIFNSAASREVTISNIVSRRDTNGTIMDAHDGTMFLHDGVYYFYGPSYGLCQEPPGPSGCASWHPGGCGYQFNHNVSLYTSLDLITWTFHGHVFEVASMPRSGIMFRPKVLPNRKTNKWVLWFRFLPTTSVGISQSLYAVAVSDAPQGPFQLVTDNLTSLAMESPGDFHLFQDENDDGYLIYTAHIAAFQPNHIMSVEKLSDDYLSTLGKEFNSGFFGQTVVEAPAMFKRNGTYYTVFGQCCCYCQNGTGVTVYTSASPLGPYQTQNYLGNEGHAQQFNILKYQTDGPNGYEYIWQGNKWQSSPDGAKGHDFAYWTPMHFDENGNVQYMNYTANFTIDVASNYQE